MNKFILCESSNAFQNLAFAAPRQRMRIVVHMFRTRLVRKYEPDKHIMILDRLRLNQSTSKDDFRIPSKHPYSSLFHNIVPFKVKY